MGASHLTPSQTMSCTNDQLDYLFQHLILPSRLPGHDDTLATNEEFLINFVIQSLSRFRELSDENDEAVTNHCISMLKSMRDARDSNGYLDSRSVQNSLKRLSEQEMQPKVRKAQQMHNEKRDTTDPRIVTELLTSLLRGAGSPAEIKAVQKRTREEVSGSG
ncbi:hypothetical protein FACUT_5113 [Fusarium acutatum]|uniref:DUF6606 domain-containing protein n=1 Tax=Fusarium acutatum TaxID=78861 RepID=A0A8H4JWK8_9HYPO|nr:hypothetical protein FACUT_5113 [Fusarium acutatum]